MAGLFKAGSAGGALGWVGFALSGLRRSRRDKAFVDQLKRMMADGEFDAARQQIRDRLAHGGPGALAQTLAICLEIAATEEGEQAARLLEAAPRIGVDELLALAKFRHATRKHEKARRAALAALDRRPDDPDALRLLADVAKATMRFDEEIEYRRRIVRRRATANAHVALGEALYASGRREQAIASFEQALVLNPLNYGAFVALRRSDESRAAIYADPADRGDDLASYAGFRAKILSGRGDAAGALTAIEGAGPAIVHGDERLALMHANLLHRTGRFAEAEAAYYDVIRIFPASDRAIVGLAEVLSDREDYVAAATLLDENAHVFKSNSSLRRRAGAQRSLDLRQKRFEAFWTSYRTDHAAVALRQLSDQVSYAPDIEALPAETEVLFCASWGIGDEISWSTVYPELRDRFERLTITCDPRLVGLFSRSYPGVSFAPSKRIMTETPSGADYDAYRALPDQILSRVFDEAGWRAAQSATAVAMVTDALAALRRRQDDFPGLPGPLLPDETLRRSWRERLAALPAGRKIGVSWRSGNRNARRDVHYTSLDEWGPIFAVEGATFVNLQYGDPGAEIAKAQATGAPLVDFPDLDLRDDFESTAALIAELDLVLAPCTAVAELAGAVGTPTIMMANSPALSPRVRPDGRDIWFANLRCVFGARMFDKASLIRATAAEIAREGRFDPGPPL